MQAFTSQIIDSLVCASVDVEVGSCSHCTNTHFSRPLRGFFLLMCREDPSDKSLGYSIVRCADYVFDTDQSH